MTSISEERAKWNAVPGHPPMRLRSQWGATRSYADARAVIEPATRVFIHITITNPSSYDSNDEHARAVERIGISRFPNTGISYNRLVMPNGALYEAQPIGRRGAHTVNDEQRSTCNTTGCPGRGSSVTAPDWNLNYNARAYSFCAIESTPVSDAVIRTFALAIYTDYKAGFITEGAARNIHGHRCVSAKACPGDRMWARMDDIQAQVNRLIASGGDEEDDMPLNDADKAWISQALEDSRRAMLNHTNPYGRDIDGQYPTLEVEWGRIDKRTYDLVTAKLDVDALATAIVAKLPTGTTNGSEIVDAVKQGVRDVLGSLND